MEIEAPYKSLRKGEMLNWYRIERILGHGGFGVIYLATDTNLDHLVAIKEYRVLVSSGAQDTHSGTQERQERANQGMHRFMTEARNLVRFKHPNIVRVMSVFELNETAYIVMEFEEGQDLRVHLRDPANACEDALKKLVVPISQGLAEVHKHGFVHRDIKPANILVRTDGTPVLLDFGSARSAGITGSNTLTALVSAGYAPLEQYSAGSESQQGPWTDIYALGAVLYFAVTGTEPVDSAIRGSALLNGGKDPLLPATMLGRDKYTEEFLGAIDWALQFRIADRPDTLSSWMSALLRSPESNPITRRVEHTTSETRRRSKKREVQVDPWHGVSMRDQPVPREVRAGRGRRKVPRKSRRMPKWWGQAAMATILLAAVLLVLQLTAPEPDSNSGTGGRTDRPISAGSESEPRQGDSPEGTAENSDGEEDGEARLRAQRLAREQAEAAAQAESDRVAAEARRTAAEQARIASLEAERQERVQVRRVQLANALSRASLLLDQGLLDDAEASLDEAASLDRNDAALRALRGRWRNALIDARTPISDDDFDKVVESFDKLRRALENNDVESMQSLTEPSNQNALFTQLMSRFSRLEISIISIRVRNADKSISATLRIESMVRDNGDRTTPSPAYSERLISSRRIEGKWSPIQW